MTRFGRNSWYRLAWLRRRQAGTDIGEPLFFHHIAKTGGTSLITAITAMTPPQLRYSEDGNVSRGFVDRLVADRLRPGQFIYGHPATGAASALRGRCRIVTLLRDPCEQAISNYLHVRTHSTVPDHAVARQLDFPAFLLARPYFAIFQTASLHVGIEAGPISRPEDLLDRLPAVFAYLHEMDLVGTTENAAILLRQLAAMRHWPTIPRFPHRRKSRVSPARRALLRRQYAELRSHRALSSLLAAEHETYREGLALDRRA